MQTIFKKLKQIYQYQNRYLSKNIHLKLGTWYNEKRVSSPKRNTVLNVYAPNNTLSKYMEQKLTELREKTDKYIILVGDVITPLSVVGRMSRQKNSKI